MNKEIFKTKQDANLLIYKKIEKISLKMPKNTCVISGGTSTLELITHLGPYLNFDNKFVLSDERLVSKLSQYSNSKPFSKLIESKKMKSLNNIILPKEKNIFNKLDEILDDFENKLKKLNVGLNILGVGEDGHIASISKRFEVIEKRDLCFLCKSKKEEFYRISVNFDFLKRARENIFLFYGKNKSKILYSVLNNKNLGLPICDLINIIKHKYLIICDDKCYTEMKKISK
tara:strand:+ start:627 stop:1316 length:690 start_codon:yes stop_codon:yes gene_type:complete